MNCFGLREVSEIAVEASAPPPAILGVWARARAVVSRSVKVGSSGAEELAQSLRQVDADVVGAHYVEIDQNGAPHPDVAVYAQKFSNKNLL